MSSRSRVGVVAASILLLFGAGCDKKGSPVRSGQLGNADFTYVCGPDTDPQCNPDSDLAAPGEVSAFPKIALGSRFAMSAAARSGPTGEYTLDASRPFFEFFDEGDRHLIRPKKVGIASILAIKGEEALDLTWVELVKADHIKFVQGTPQGTFKDGSIAIGKNGVTAQASVVVTFKFRAVAADKDDKILAGAFDCKWTTSDPAIANITSPPTANIVTVVSGKAGTATLHATLGDLAGDIALTVN
jgi:hypothetical protein